MATKKDKPADDGAEFVPFTGGVVESAKPADDREALLAQIDELKARLAERDAQAEAEAETAPGPMRFWRVELQYVPTRIVEARDQANAFEVFKRISGIITSDFTPSIAAASGPCGVFRPDGKGAEKFVSDGQPIAA